MKVYPEMLRDRNMNDIPLVIDVTCVDCGKVHALSNCAHGQRCIKCGGHCK